MRLLSKCFQGELKISTNELVVVDIDKIPPKCQT